MPICDSIKQMIERINPNIIAVDNLLNAGFDVCYSLNWKFVITSPNTPVDLARAH